MADASGLNSIEIAEHVGPVATGDNINAKRAAGYSWDGSNWQRNPVPFFSMPYDEILITYTDSTKATIQTAVSKLGGVTQQTITLTAGTTTDDYVRT